MRQKLGLGPYKIVYLTRLAGGLALVATLGSPPTYANPTASQSSETTMPSCSPGAHATDTNDVMSRNIKAERTEEDHVIAGEHVKTLTFKHFVIDKIYPSMRGPWSSQNIQLDAGPGGRYAWITAYRGEPVDQATGKVAPEFMCHTDLGLEGMHGFQSQLGTSQGQTELQFPDGFGYREETKSPSSLELIGMVLNNNNGQIGRTLDFRFTIHYLDDQAAKAQKLKPLVLTAAVTECVTAGAVGKGEFACEPAIAGKFWTDHNHVSRTLHWLIPPGRHTYTTDVTALIRKPYDTTIHYIRMHVHPYGESLELRDVTANRTVWKGTATHPEDPQDARILSTDVYSSTGGLPLLKDHRYEFTAVYNNRTDHKIDAMAGLWMYTLDKN